MTPARKYQLAEACMRGDRAAWEELGRPENLGEVDAIMRDAFEALTPAEQADDLASVQRALGNVDRTKS
jgi:hypothetical protein